MISKRSIPFDRWKHKVDHHIRYLIGYDPQHLEHFLYRNYYDNDFSPKVVAFLAVKNCHNLQDSFSHSELWIHELQKYLQLFMDLDEAKICVDSIQTTTLFHQGLHPVYVSEEILQRYGYLPKPKFEFGISPPKF